MRTLVLRNAHVHAEILPDFGAGLSRLDYVGAAEPVPVLRPFVYEGADPRPNQLACFPLVPWSNRMDGGFTCEGRTYQIPPNRPDVPYPMHGDGWKLPWEVMMASDSQVVLILDRRAGTPFSYHAQISYSLAGRALHVSLEVINVGPVVLPFGMGLHPWIPRTPGVTLQAPARQVWLSTPDSMPTHAASIPEEWSFLHAHELPQGLIDNAFEGWGGSAAVAWPEKSLALEIESDCGYYIVYAPEGKDFFCFEPVDHLINAHNMAGGPERHGLTMLSPGQRLRRSFAFGVRVL